MLIEYLLHHFSFRSDSESEDAFTAKKKHLEEKAALLNKEIEDLESSDIEWGDESTNVETLTNRQSLEAAYGKIPLSVYPFKNISMN